MTREELLAAIPGGAPEQEPRAPKSRAARLASILAGAAEIPMSVGSSMATFPAAVLGGAGDHGRFKRIMEAGTYVPRSEAGQEGMEILGKGMEKAKIPPYVPIVRGMGTLRMPSANEAFVGGVKALEKPIRAATEQAPGIPRGAMTAVKPAPGGHWTPLSQQRLAALLTSQEGEAGLDFTGPQHVKDWAEKASTRWFSKYAGTDRDPARALNLGTAGDPVTFEQLVDKSLRKTRAEQLTPENRPALARAAEEVWNFNPRPQLAQFLQHAGDYARTLAPEDLARTDIPTLLRKVHEADRRQLTTKSKALGAREAAAQRITAEHPGGPAIVNPQANWYEFKKGMDPEAVKMGLSVDSCIGEHCIAGLKHGKPEWGYPAWAPVRDIVSGRKMQDIHPEASLPDTTAYINKILSGQAKGYSLRDPQGQPLATSFVGSTAPKGVLRRDMRSKILTPKQYLKWFESERLRGDPTSQRVQLPGQMAQVEGQGPAGEGIRQQVQAGRGHMVPARPLLGPEDLDSIMRMYPDSRPAIEALAIKRMQVMEQMKGRRNMGVPPEYTARLAELIGKADLQEGVPGLSPAGGDLSKSGISIVGGKPRTVQELIAAQPELAAHFAERGPDFGEVINMTRGSPGLKGLTQEQTSALDALVRLLEKTK